MHVPTEGLRASCHYKGGWLGGGTERSETDFTLPNLDTRPVAVFDVDWWGKMAEGRQSMASVPAVAIKLFIGSENVGLVKLA